MLLKQNNQIYKVLGLLLLIFFAPEVGFAEVHNWQTGFQAPASVSMEKFINFHHLLLKIIISIVVFVTLLLLFICIKFYHKKHPVPAKFTDNPLIEVVWTLIPFIILAVIAIPSFRLLYYVDTIGKMDMTVKVVGRQWYWQYEYPTEHVSFDSNMIADRDLKDGQHRLFDVDNPIVLPIDTNIRFLITGGDVMHSFSIPAFGIKTDAVPGRINETWVNITKTGHYYGQCSELCGIGHGFMPISVIAVSKEDYQKWLEQAKLKFANN